MLISESSLVRVADERAESTLLIFNYKKIKVYLFLTKILEKYDRSYQL